MDATRKGSTHKKSNSSQQKKRVDLHWVGTVFAVTILISGGFSFLSSILLNHVHTAAAFLVLFLIVLIGILFDVIGVAVTAAEEKPFHSMAARNVPEARDAIRLIRHAGRVSSFCNDVVGDICGVISGSASAAIAARVILNFTPAGASIVSLLMSALAAALTVGGKALGKTFAINESTAIVHFAARVVHHCKAIPNWLRGLFRFRRS